MERKKELIGMLDGVRGTAERLGPSVDYVRLQLSLALAETVIDPAAAEGRLMETFDYIARIGEMPSRGQAYATFLGELKKIPSSVKLQSGDSLEQSCTSELEAVVLTLSDATADHYLSLGDIITGLAPGDIDKALDYTKLVNTAVSYTHLSSFTWYAWNAFFRLAASCSCPMLAHTSVYTACAPAIASAASCVIRIDAPETAARPSACDTISGSGVYLSLIHI